MFEDKLTELLTSGGASLVGFSKIGESPIKNQPELIYAVTLVYKLSDAVLKTIEDRPSMAYFQHYRAVNAKLDSLCLDAVRFIENQGYNAFPIAASQSTNDDKSAYRGIFAHKTGACWVWAVRRSTPPSFTPPPPTSGEKTATPSWAFRWPLPIAVPPLCRPCSACWHSPSACGSTPCLWVRLRCWSWR